MKFKEKEVLAHLSPSERKELDKPKTLVFVNYREQHLHGGEICKGQENDAWPSFEDSYQSFDLLSITKENVSPYHEQFLLHIPKGTKGLHVVVVRYRDGGTFSSTSGYGSIQGVFLTAEEARGLAKNIEDGGEDRERYRGRRRLRPAKRCLFARESC